MDPQEEQDLFDAWFSFSTGKLSEGYFSPKRKNLNPPKVVWPKISINQGLNDFNKMALREFGNVSNQLAIGSGNILNVRCNFGTSIIPLLFGVKIFLMDENLDTLPTSYPLNDKRAIQSLINAGVPDLYSGFGQKVFDMGEYYAEIGNNYPKIGKYIHVFHPDLQGPMDICEVVWGSSLFLDVHDDPKLVHEFLALTVETYCAFMHIWNSIFPFSSEVNTHWGMMFKGSIMLREDSGTNFSQRMYEQFIFPYNQLLLDEFGGGAIHFCGKGDHFISALTNLSGLSAVNISQPELNDMEKIFKYTIDKGIQLIGLNSEAVEKSTRNFHGQVHCI